MSIKIAIGIPTRGEIKAKTALSLMETMKLPYTFFNIFDYSNDIWHSRENIVKIASDNLCSHIFFLDSDMEFPSDTLQKLVEADKDIIGADYNFKYMPRTQIAEPLFSKNLGPYEVKGMGLGCMLIKMSVFETLSHPYFLYPAEDFAFCQKARELGFEVWADGSIKVGHIGEFSY